MGVEYWVPTMGWLIHHPLHSHCFMTFPVALLLLCQQLYSFSTQELSFFTSSPREQLSLKCQTNLFLEVYLVPSSFVLPLAPWLQIHPNSHPVRFVTRPTMTVLRGWCICWTLGLSGSRLKGLASGRSLLQDRGCISANHAGEKQGNEGSSNPARVGEIFKEQGRHFQWTGP